MIKKRLTLLMVCLLIAGMGLTGCKKELKKGKVEVKDYQFILRQDSQLSYAVDAKGTVQNTGPYNVKNIVITGSCDSCGNVVVNGQWFVSDYEKTDEQKAVISYLTPGDEAPFEFKGVAYLMQQEGQKPEKMPDSMAVKVVSFETVQE